MDQKPKEGEMERYIIDDTLINDHAEGLKLGFIVAAKNASEKELKKFFGTDSIIYIRVILFFIQLEQVCRQRIAVLRQDQSILQLFQRQGALAVAP